MDIIGRTESSLAASMEALLGRRPRLRVVSISRSKTPAWAVPPLSPEADVLVRWTGYSLESADLSRHIAAVDLSAIDPGTATALESGAMALTEVLDDPRIQKGGVQVGMLGRAGIGGDGLRRSFEARGMSGSLACRRYHFTMDGVPAGVVIEVLPCEMWERLTVGSDPARARSRR
jgi:hypothetical protein